MVDLYEFSSVLQRLVEEANLSSELLEGPFVGLQISIRESGDVTILDLQGRSTIDGGESELLYSRLKQLVAHGVRKLLLNLADLTQVDSSGVGAIVAA
jgi:anti-anti-sigma factor